MIRLVVRLTIWISRGIVRGIGRAIGRWDGERTLRLSPSLPRFLAHDSKSAREGVTLEQSTRGNPNVALYVTVRGRPDRGRTPRLVRERDWGARDRPSIARAVEALPVHDADTRCDDASAAALPAFEASWRRLTSIVAHAILVSDGEQTIGWIVADRAEQVEALADAVVAVARWDVELAGLLAELPEARPLFDDRFYPAVLLPGDVRVGGFDGRVLVKLGEVTRPVARDRGEILAKVAELRATRSGAPFR